MIIDSTTKYDCEIKKENFDLRMYIILFIVFVIGIILGSIYFRLMIMRDIAEYNELIQKVNIEHHQQTSDIIKNLIFKNFKNIILYWILGVSVVGTPFLILLCLYSGISNSIIFSLIISKLGFISGNTFNLKYMLMPMAFEVFALFFITVSSIKTSINVLKNKKDIKIEIVRHTLFCIVAMLMLIISGILEVVVR